MYFNPLKLVHSVYLLQEHVACHLSAANQKMLHVTAQLQTKNMLHVPSQLQTKNMLIVSSQLQTKND